MLKARDVFDSHPIGGSVITNPWDVDNTNGTPYSFVATSTPPRSRFSRLNGNESAPESLVSSSSSSTSPSPSGRSGLRSRKAGSHRRASTVDGSLSSHPLQSQSHAQSQPQSPTTPTPFRISVTRPALNCRLGSFSEFDFDESKREASEDDVSEYGGQKSSREAEVMVVVHEITRSDSIEGIALKYGISLADLRRANHLWPSDSIHLRKVLYTPLHMSSRKDLFYPTNELGKAQAINGESPAEASTSARTSVVVQRIPLSQLAFFPPPSQPSLSPDSERKRSAFPATISTTNAISSPSLLTTRTPSRIHSESSGTQSLAALLRALPLPSREVLFPRLSFDSSETSSTANASETSSDQEHEMDLLGKSRIGSRKRTLSGGGERALLFKGKGKMKERDHRNSAASIETLKMGGMYNDEESLDTPLVPLQTEQLKPSPQMRLPRVLQRDNG